MKNSQIFKANEKKIKIKIKIKKIKKIKKKKRKEKKSWESEMDHGSFVNIMTRSPSQKTATEARKKARPGDHCRQRETETETHKHEHREEGKEHG